MKAEFPDTLEHQGATRLQRKIENAWHRQGLLERGFKTWLERIVARDPNARPIYAVRSNMTFDRHGDPILKPRTAPLLDGYPE